MCRYGISLSFRKEGSEPFAKFPDNSRLHNSIETISAILMNQSPDVSTGSIIRNNRPYKSHYTHFGDFAGHKIDQREHTILCTDKNLTFFDVAKSVSC